MKKSCPVGFGGTEGIVEKANLYAGFRTLLEGLYELLADGVVVDDDGSVGD